jgi:hypothetical protein
MRNQLRENSQEHPASVLIQYNQKDCVGAESMLLPLADILPYEPELHLLLIKYSTRKKHLNLPDPYKGSDGYSAGARACWLMEDVRLETFPRDIQEAEEQYELLPPIEQYQSVLNWLIETDRTIIDKIP